MTIHHLEVRRTARVATLGDLDTATDIWLVLHGFAQLAERFVRPFESIVERGRAIVAPEALNRFYLDTAPKAHGPSSRVGATWMTREDRESDISDYVAYLGDVTHWIRSSAGARDVRLRLLGFSQGVATACRYVAYSDARIDELILWAGAIPEDIDLVAHGDAFRRVPVTLVVGDADEFAPWDRVEMLVARLGQHEVPHRLVTFEGGHVIHEPTLQALLAAGQVSARA